MTRGSAWPRPISRNPERSNAADSPYPWLSIPLSTTLSPPLASLYGFSMATAARRRILRRRKGATGLGEGKGAREAARRATVRRRPGWHFSSRGGPGSARGGWGGSGRGAPIDYLASRHFPYCLRPHGVSGEGLTWFPLRRYKVQFGLFWPESSENCAPRNCCQRSRMGSGPADVRCLQGGTLPRCRVVRPREGC